MNKPISLADMRLDDVVYPPPWAIYTENELHNRRKMLRDKRNKERGVVDDSAMDAVFFHFLVAEDEGYLEGWGEKPPYETELETIIYTSMLDETDVQSIRANVAGVFPLTNMYDGLIFDKHRFTIELMNYALQVAAMYYHDPYQIASYIQRKLDPVVDANDLDGSFENDVQDHVINISDDGREAMSRYMNLDHPDFLHEEFFEELDEVHSELLHIGYALVEAMCRELGFRPVAIFRYGMESEHDPMYVLGPINFELLDVADDFSWFKVSYALPTITEGYLDAIC